MGGAVGCSNNTNFGDSPWGVSKVTYPRTQSPEARFDRGRLGSTAVADAVCNRESLGICKEKLAGLIVVSLSPAQAPTSIAENSLPGLAFVNWFAGVSE